jgi:hypothetical protein
MCPKSNFQPKYLKNKKNENKNYSGFVIHVKLLNLTDEYLIYHVELSMLKSNMSNLASINEWNIFTLFQVFKKFNFGISKKIKLRSCLRHSIFSQNFGVC